VSTIADYDELEPALSKEDQRFDLAFPPEIRDLSRRHWTPLAVAHKAAELLVSDPGTRVLDIGCGPGKFCVVGALTTLGHFTGVEQRPCLAGLARDVIRRTGIQNADIIEANVADVDFSAYDAFYLFNPFEENLFKMGRIDASVELSEVFYNRYTRYVAEQLSRAPLGTRVVTYYGYCEEIPLCYRHEGTWFDDTLRLWRKTEPSPTETLSVHGRNPAIRADLPRFAFV
jgi:SAM-dependent methyltransferase